MTYPFGVDISKYQYGSDGKQKPDFDRLNASCDFVAVRAGISWGYTDPWFTYSWAHITKPRLAYHVPYFGEDAGRQMTHFLNIVHPGIHDRLVLDAELDHGLGKAKITSKLARMVDILRDETGRRPILYSRALWLNQFVDLGAIGDVDLWLANYLKRRPAPLFTPEHAGPPLLPKGASTWLIHQTGERGNGSAVGVVSHYVDTNRWNGTKSDMLAYFGLEEEVPPEPPNDTQFQARVYSWATPYVNIRQSPSISSKDLGDLYPNTVVNVVGVTGDWYQNTAGITQEHGAYPAGWVMSQYLQRLDYDDPPVVLDLAYWGPVYNQRDTRWKDHPLGTKSTIGANGCLMTCASMVCNHFGHASNPYSLNEWLTNNEGYLDGNLFLWDAIERLHPDLKFDGFVYSPIEAVIAAYIQRGQLPIMFVDFNDDTPLIEMHWVLGIGVENGRVIIADPWTGTMGRLSEMYPKQVIRFGSYRRQA